VRRRGVQGAAPVDEQGLRRGGEPRGGSPTLGGEGEGIRFGVVVGLVVVVVSVVVAVAGVVRAPAVRRSCERSLLKSWFCCCCWKKKKSEL